MRTIRNIKAKLSLHNATILKADKGNTIVICYISSYYSKTQEIITNNQFSTINNDPTSVFQKEIHKVINNCKIIVHKEDKWKHINLNLSALSMKGLPKNPQSQCTNLTYHQLAKCPRL